MEILASYILPLGKYKGKTIGDLAYEDYDYLLWCADNFGNHEMGHNIRKFLHYENDKIKWGENCKAYSKYYRKTKYRKT